MRSTPISTESPTLIHRVCILIPTYKRNDLLLQLINQSRDLIDRYRGRNHYELCVTDSDPNNPMAPLPPHLKVQYSINPGSGFDDNIYYFWQNNVDEYDFIFHIGDDDLFASWLNPLYLLDAAIETGNYVSLFNHRYYKYQPDGGIELSGVNYPEVGLICNKTQLRDRVLTILPNHIGVLYSTRFLKIMLKEVSEFRDTLHLYAVPIILAAAAHRLLFSDHVLCLYHQDFISDGAWSSSDDLMNGIIKFLQKLKHVVPSDLYDIAEAGYFSSYFGSNCWLRERLRYDPSLKSEAQIREMLATP